MKRDQRRLQKRERSSKFDRPKPTEPAAAPVQPPLAPVPPEGIPICWVVLSGRKFYHRGYKCENGHYQEQPCSAEEYENDPISGEISCDRCELTARCWSAGSDCEYRHAATGELYRGHRELPVGAVYEHPVWNDEAHNWTTNNGKSIIHRANKQDGRILCCKLPDGHSWTIDSRANNCTLPDDDKHWCWIRHGRPEDGTLHVDKDGLTCSAGAGSIQTGRWHGFLRHGRLVL